jgi:hypothetical protein
MTLIGITTRAVTFGHDGQTRRFPAGTDVYVTVRSGICTIRVPWTLWTQDVHAATVRIP